MGFFSQNKPRSFQHQWIYVDERKEKLQKIEENAKRDLGMLPPKETTPEERIRGSFVEHTKHLKRRKEKKPTSFAVLLILLAVMLFILHYLVTGELSF